MVEDDWPAARVIEFLTKLAADRSDGHFTILKFITNWRVALDTPFLDQEAREQIERWPVGETLGAALLELLRRSGPEPDVIHLTSDERITFQRAAAREGQ